MKGSANAPQARWLVLSLFCFTLLNGCVNFWPGGSLTSDQRVQGAATLQAFQSLQAPLRMQGITVLDKRGRQLGMATWFGQEGLLLAKASDVANQGRLQIDDARGQRHPVTLAGLDDLSDVALLNVQAQGTPPPRPSMGTWSASPPSEGEWVACLEGTNEVKVGVVSGRARRIPEPRPLLGIFLKPTSDQPGAVIDEVVKKGAADRAGLKADDRIVSVNGDPIRDYQSLQDKVRSLEPGLPVTIEYVRAEDLRKKTFPLGDDSWTEGDERNRRMSGPVSSRRAGFEEVFQHDSPVNPKAIGGPVVNLDGKVVGMNIARTDRVTTYALTPRAIRQAVWRIQGDLSN